MTGALLPNAPNLAGNADFMYNLPMSGAVGIELTGNAAYAKSDWTNTTNNRSTREEDCREDSPHRCPDGKDQGPRG
jgi:hypothetical protein